MTTWWMIAAVMLTLLAPLAILADRDEPRPSPRELEPWW